MSSGVINGPYRSVRAPDPYRAEAVSHPLEPAPPRILMPPADISDQGSAGSQEMDIRSGDIQPRTSNVDRALMTRSHAARPCGRADQDAPARDRRPHDLPPRTGAGARPGARAGCAPPHPSPRDPSRRPARWTQPAFGAEVELIRRHLAPVRTRQTLAASYGREAFHVASDDRATDDPSPIRLAYALRWMELRDGATGPSWPTLVG
jgi:hypothetical protein